MSDYTARVQDPDSYNGASHDNFSWSQSISDLDVLLNIPSSLMSPRDLKVSVSSKEIKVAIREKNITGADSPEKWSHLLNGQLSFPVKQNETIWSLIPSQHIHIHLEKAAERWWEALIVGEAKIKLSEIDCSRDYSELKPIEQSKLQELMWYQQQKLLSRSSDK
ncbi:GSCOCG00000711001-RA-CDS [Cotesia congregata]|uniref:Similar to NUDCD3: NudC domain-containing protein 3 (Homo sapiens) n=1 Tax=Cotesia congregata TaxID=51543 RepID=A0A8J2MJB9_COTCN|nr:GSCOCG00000711001-RA-CDS [Cotesia congregata]CAG5087097.1 Similar to NUDCD3: NudC domain-containing protein 3 (Homo sapiens) [Cotesia congregata]